MESEQQLRPQKTVSKFSLICVNDVFTVTRISRLKNHRRCRRRRRRHLPPFLFSKFVYTYQDKAAVYRLKMFVFSDS